MSPSRTSGVNATYDVAEFEETLHKAEVAEDSEQDEVAVRKEFSYALGMYIGEFGAEFQRERFLRSMRNRLRSKWNRGARRSLRLLAGARRWTEVIQLAETGLGYSPGYEPFHYYHVLAWLKCGNARWPSVHSPGTSRSCLMTRTANAANG
jgi:hypothetical protein